ncbi:MAG: LysM peptidoglycan-binding domain-containing protein, partial [Syntrophales bacterium LBB04]|nr:LysM peptidoglycan-binding domain-containing protein [Syntrophales bacterium LBB04]
NKRLTKNTTRTEDALAAEDKDITIHENLDTKREVEQDVMERALELLNNSQENWVHGNVQDALDALDQAYAILLDTNGDIDVARQKDDLRLLISKKILAIYTSKHTVTNGKYSEIPSVMNAEVEREIRSFQTVERDFFISSYQRASFFRPTVVKALKKAGMPVELSWLPLVESGFKIRALSRARALGLWQFIPSTGYKYGLNRDDWVDERMDVEKSTQAAIDYMKDLHEMFGDWLTVLAAYNCGEGRLLRVISGQHINYLDRFWDLYNQLPNETARYVPRFLATLEIIKDPKKYGMDLAEPVPEKQSLYAYDKVKANKIMKIQDIASSLEITEDQLNVLNAELRHNMTPDREYNLKIPPLLSDKYAQVIDNIPQAEKPRLADSHRQLFLKHKVKAGESLASIAKRYKTTTSTIRKQNGFLAKSEVRSGQNLIISVRAPQSSKTTVVKESNPEKLASSNGLIKYKVKKSDTLYSLSQHFGMSIDDIKRLNNIKGARLKVNQTLTFNIKPASEVNATKKTDKQTAALKIEEQTKKAETNRDGAARYVVKKGDNLKRIALRSGSNIDQLMKLNKITARDAIQPGQVIVLR